MKKKIDHTAYICVQYLNIYVNANECGEKAKTNPPKYCGGQ